MIQGIALDCCGEEVYEPAEDSFLLADGLLLKFDLSKTRVKKIPVALQQCNETLANIHLSTTPPHVVCASKLVVARAL